MSASRRFSKPVLAALHESKIPAIRGREIAVRAKSTRGERLLKAIDLAYGAKYPTPGSQKWVRGFARGRRRTTTTELVPR